MAEKIKAKLAKGLIACGYAIITEDIEADTFEIGEPKWLPSVKAGSREITADPRGENTPVYADSRIVFADNENEGYDIKLILLAMCDDVEKDWYNNTITADGVAEYSDSGEFPKFALFTIENTTDGIGKTTIYYNCQCAARLSKSGKTKESGSFEFAFPEYAITASPRPSDNLVKYEINAKEKFKVAVPEPKENTTTEV